VVETLPSEQAVIDATSVVIATQKNAGIDLPTDGELYRFDPNHPDTNGMIEYFVSRLGGIGFSAGEMHGGCRLHGRRNMSGIDLVSANVTHGPCPRIPRLQPHAPLVGISRRGFHDRRGHLGPCRKSSGNGPFRRP
jgi:hypothetical protein